MKVKATSTGLYDNMLRKPGHPLGVFDIKSEAEFAWEWMEPIGWTPKSQRPGFFMETNTEGEEVKKSAEQIANERADALLSSEAAAKNSEAAPVVSVVTPPPAPRQWLFHRHPYRCYTNTRSRTGSSGSGATLMINGQGL